MVASQLLVLTILASLVTTTPLPSPSNSVLFSWEPAPDTPFIRTPFRDSTNTKYRLAWSDTFTSKELNTTTWKAIDKVCDNFPFDQYCSPENVELNNGVLRLWSTLDNNVALGGGVISKRAFRPGFYQFKMKVPKTGKV
jgi:hypothetical protein